jgi:hypothetical protein
MSLLTRKVPATKPLGQFRVALQWSQAMVARADVKDCKWILARRENVTFQSIVAHGQHSWADVASPPRADFVAEVI